MLPIHDRVTPVLDQIVLWRSVTGKQFSQVQSSACVTLVPSNESPGMDPCSHQDIGSIYIFVIPGA